MSNEIKILLEERPEGAGFVHDRTKDGTRYYSHSDYPEVVFRVTYGSDGKGDDGILTVEVQELLTQEQQNALTEILSPVFFEGPRFRSKVQVVKPEGADGVTWFRSVDGSSF